MTFVSPMSTPRAYFIQDPEEDILPPAQPLIERAEEGTNSTPTSEAAARVPRLAIPCRLEDLSKRFCLFQNPPTDEPIQRAFRDDVDLSTQEIFEGQYKIRHIKKAALWVHVDQEINIARRSRITTRHRAKYPNIPSTILRSQAKDFTSFSL